MPELLRAQAWCSPISVLRYGPGDHFKLHHDHCPASPRIWTAIMYLCAVFCTQRHASCTQFAFKSSAVATHPVSYDVMPSLSASQKHTERWRRDRVPVCTDYPTQLAYACAIW